MTLIDPTIYTFIHGTFHSFLWRLDITAKKQKLHTMHTYADLSTKVTDRFIDPIH